MDMWRGTVPCGQTVKSQEAKFCSAGPTDSGGFQPEVLALSMMSASLLSKHQLNLPPP